MNQENNTNSFVVSQDQYVYQGVGSLDKSNSCLFAEGIPSSCDIPIIQMVPHPLESDIPQHSRISFPSQSIPSFQFTQVSYDGGLLYQGGMQLRGYGGNFWTPNPIVNSATSATAHSSATNHDLLPDDAQYYVEIQRFLETREAPVGSTDKYKAHLTERSEHYQIIDGLLYHGKKRPRKVCMRKEEQMELMQKNHVIGDTGVHRGVKKMFTILKDQVFWRGMYRDIVTFVKGCSKCFDATQPSPEGVTDVFKEETLPSCEKSIQTASQVWKNVEVGLYQFPHVTKTGHDSILTLSDPESLYLTGWAVNSSKDSDHALSSRIVSAFALLGLPMKIIITALRPVLVTELSSKIANLSPANQVHVVDGPSCTPWLPQLLNIYVSSKPGSWDTDLEAYLFQWCCGKGSKEETWRSPFSQMFSRRYPPFFDSDDKENINDQLLTTCPSDDEMDALNVEEASVSSNIGKNNESSKRPAEFKPPHQDVKSTVKEVKAILSETKESRRRRGKYQKYHPEIQELMTEFAIKKGSLSASQIFSKVLRTKVSESTIRNLIRAQLNLHPLLKAEIGKYAYEHGPDKACRVYSSKLHTNLPMNLVRKLQMIYFTRLTRKKNEEAAERRLKIETLSEKVKYDIGFFASTHSNQETVRHFMEKGIDIDEEVVKEVVKYLRPNTHPIIENHEPPSSRENMSLVELLKHPLLKETSDNAVGSIGCIANVSPINQPFRSTEPLPNNNIPSINPGIETLLVGQSCNSNAKQSKSREISKKRGQYSSYSPELRAEIGKFAAEHGPLKASVHFTNLLGREIPESTARGLKDKYLKKAKSQPVTSLGFGQRGRPLRLGKYDEAVQDCLRELVRSGEKVTSFLAITTAKKIVSKYEPNLLKENGGPIDLNVSWAKSFLKRIGVSNKS